MNIITPNLNFPKQVLAETGTKGSSSWFWSLLIVGTVIYLGNSYLKENEIKLFKVKKPINNTDFP